MLMTSTLCRMKGSSGDCEFSQEEMSGFFQAAAGVEQNVVLAGDFDAHAEIFVRLQVIDDHVGEVMHVDDHFANAEGAQARERDLQQRAAADFHQRLGAIIGERPQTRAQAGGQNHGLHLPCFSSSRWRTTTLMPLRARRCFANCSAR